MTTRTEAGAEKSFVSALLPWIIAGLLAIVYLLTLNHWLSFGNLQSVARASGQIWVPDLYSPLFNLVTSPFRWLPEGLIPLAMNFFSVVCAFFVLALLARSVALLPHDRTHLQREREQGPFSLLSLSMAWIPPVLAVIVCGLQLTFWENATSLSNGMFNLVLFAYSVRCLLEYRIHHRESWLLRAAVVYAAGATDTWVMLGLVPAFLVAMIWIRGLGFFQLRFLARLFLCVLAGLLFYLYLPLLHLRSEGLFWMPLKANIGAQFLQLEYIFRYTPHHVQFLLTLTSLLPILVIGIRWKSSFGDTSDLGIALATWTLHIAHAALLAVCIWAAFDTGFSLRDPAGRFPILAANRDRFLALYYLGALGIGYLSGYFLLVFKAVTRRGGRRSTPSNKFLNAASVAVICVLLVFVPLGLLFKNVPEIKITNGPALQNYASLVAEKLPPNGVILSDSSGPLLLTRAWLARTGKAANFLFLDTHAIKSTAYYRFQTRQHPDLWPQIPTNINNNAILGDVSSINLLAALAEKHPVYYLQPSFGYYFEYFYVVPHGLINELKPYSTNDLISPPPLPEAVFAENEAFWKQHDSELSALVPAVTDPTSQSANTFRQRWMETMHIPFEKNFEASQLGSVYSRALNSWGVQAQRMGRLEAAGAHFDKAVQLSPDNIVAHANSEFNTKLRKGEHVAAEDPSSFEQRFGKFNGWQNVLDVNGSFDEPTGCLAQAIVFARGRLNREAAQNFLRTLALAPESLLARLWLARVYVVLNMPDKAFPLIDELKARSDSFADAAINASDVFQAELAASYADNKPDRIKHLVASTLSQNPPNPVLLNTAARVCTFYKDYTNALLIVDKQLEAGPNDVTMLVNKGFLQIKLTNYNAAIPPLSKAISLQPTNSPALFSRAVSYFESGKFDEAQRDYETLQKLNPQAYVVYHGLADVALRKKDTNAAIRFYQLDLTNTAPDSPEAKFAADRIKNLKTGSP